MVIGKALIIYDFWQCPNTCWFNRQEEIWWLLYQLTLCTRARSTFANSEDPDEKCSIMLHFIWVFTVCKGKKRSSEYKTFFWKLYPDIPKYGSHQISTIERYRLIFVNQNTCFKHNDFLVAVHICLYITAICILSKGTFCSCLISCFSEKAFRKRASSY